MSDYYKCLDSKVVVEVGAAYGGQVAYHLKNSPFLEEYHVVDPFMAGYDPDDPMSQTIRGAAPDASPEDISKSWAQALSKHLGTDGSYSYVLDETSKKKTKITMEPGGCRLRIHRQKSVSGAALFEGRSVDAVFIDGLHTYEGVVEDIQAWKDKITEGGALIFNDFFYFKEFPGISKAVLEFAESINAKVYDIDGSNAVVGGRPECTLGEAKVRSP